MNGNTPQPVAASDPAAGVREPQIGDKIGSYRLLRMIGEGAAGRVFEVEHLKVGRRAAMKILAPGHAARPGAIKRLFSEARAVNKINHPHIVEVTDLIQAEDEGDINAIVMELLEGESLGHAMQPPGAMGPERYVPIMVQVAGALTAAHAADFVHRDLKPDNIFLTARAGQRDYVKLLDFGLAKSIAGDLAISPAPAGPVSLSTAMPPPMSAAEPQKASRSTIVHATADGTFVGTPAYASPEQAAGKPLDRRTDIYSLGVILYELLCGRLPFEGNNFGEYLVKHITAPVPPPPADVMRSSIGRQLFSVAERCLAKNPADRWASAAELTAVFDSLAASASSMESPRISTAAALASRSKKWPAIAAFAAAALVAGALAWVLLSSGGPHLARSTARAVEAQATGPVVVPLVFDKSVVITFESDPPGAETRRVGDPDLLGLTDFKVTRQASDKEEEIEMVLPGYVPRRFKLLPNADATVGGRLRRIVATQEPKRAESAAPSGAAPPASRHKVTRGTTLNPFAP